MIPPTGEVPPDAITRRPPRIRDKKSFSAWLRSPILSAVLKRNALRWYLYLLPVGGLQNGVTDQDATRSRGRRQQEGDVVESDGAWYSGEGSELILHDSNRNGRPKPR